MDPATLDRLREYERELVRKLSGTWPADFGGFSDGTINGIRVCAALFRDTFPELHPNDKDIPDAK